jgi:DNA repair exonuclease SbcCD ATPase subunit
MDAHSVSPLLEASMGLDERTREDLRQWLQNAKGYLWAFVAGGFLAFAYTYFPLHGAKDRKIDTLEDRLQHETGRFAELEGEFETMRAGIDSQPLRDAHQELKEELAGATTRHGDLEDKLDRADRKVRDLEKSRRSWKSKYAKLEKARDDLALDLGVANTNLIAALEAAAKREAKLNSSASQTRNEPDRGRNLASGGSRPASASPDD